MAEDDNQMHMPKAKNEINVNTAIQIFGFLVLIAGMGASWGLSQGRIDKVVDQTAKNTTSIGGLSEETNKIDGLAYRITVQEQSQSDLSESVEELKMLVNGQGADLRVVKEILGRIDKKLDDRTQ